ncbi:hypothetical protein Golax_011222, partial [Gossypium laxum]|nr:hypothetical protein [Gossypium laxum]
LKTALAHLEIQFHVTSDIVILLAVSQFPATKTPF